MLKRNHKDIESFKISNKDSTALLTICASVFVITFVNFTHGRSSHPEVFLEKDVLKIYSKFAVEHPCRSVISIKLQSNFIEIALRHGCSPVNLPHIFRAPFSKNTSGGLLLTWLLKFSFWSWSCVHVFFWSVRYSP